MIVGVGLPRCFAGLWLYDCIVWTDVLLIELHSADLWSDRGYGTGCHCGARLLQQGLYSMHGFVV